MGYGYDSALRERVIKAVEEGSSARRAGERFEIGVATAIRWVRRWRESGSPMDAPRKSKGSPLDPYVDWLVDLRKREPDLRLVDIAERLHTGAWGQSAQGDAFPPVPALRDHLQKNAVRL